MFSWLCSSGLWTIASLFRYLTTIIYRLILSLQSQGNGLTSCTNKTLTNNRYSYRLGPYTAADGRCLKDNYGRMDNNHYYTTGQGWHERYYFCRAKNVSLYQTKYVPIPILFLMYINHFYDLDSFMTITACMSHVEM